MPSRFERAKTHLERIDSVFSVSSVAQLTRSPPPHRRGQSAGSGLRQRVERRRGDVVDAHQRGVGVHHVEQVEDRADESAPSAAAVPERTIGKG